VNTLFFRFGRFRELFQKTVPLKLLFILYKMSFLELSPADFDKHKTNHTYFPAKKQADYFSFRFSFSKFKIISLSPRFYPGSFVITLRFPCIYCRWKIEARFEPF